LRGKPDAVAHGSTGRHTALLSCARAFRYFLNVSTCGLLHEEPMMRERLSPEELAVLFKRLDGLITEARVLQEQIRRQLDVTGRRDRQDRTGQPERRRRPRNTPG
jgi:hypothetical protein